MPHYNFHHAVIGGTFDRLHKGHRHLLDMAFSLADTITIGITSDTYAAQKSDRIEPLNKRLAQLKSYSFGKIDKRRLHIIVIDDVFGTTLHDKTMDVIVTTKETRKQASEINKKRRKNALPALAIKTGKLVKDAHNFIIRSSRIRSGEIDREGTLYASYFGKHTTLIMPNELRHTLKTPLGSVVPNETHAFRIIKPKSPFLITVGDIVTRTLKKAGASPQVSVIDFKTQRVEIDHPQTTSHKIVNKPGTLSYKAVQALRHAIRQSQNGQKNISIIIRGEEDLLALPAILFAPLSAYVCYGLTGKGIVTIEVTENIKKKVQLFIQQFQPKRTTR